VKSLMSLWRELADELASWCCTSAKRDSERVAFRVEKEGESFLTISLPQFAKDLEQALDAGSFDSSLFRGYPREGGYPVFLQGFLSQIFNSDGLLLHSPNVDCIFAIRTLASTFSKIERPCTQARTDRAMERFVEIEAELKAFDSSRFEEFLPRFRKSSTLLFGDVFAHAENTFLGTHHLRDDWLAVDRLSGDDMRFSHHERGTDAFMHLLPRSMRPGRVRGQIGEIVDPSRGLGLVPRHGPGATADRLRGNAKYSVSKWPLRLEREFPYGDYALPSWRSYYQLDRVEFLELGSEVPVKVTPVPKTLKTPRIIAEETTAVQYCQQALAKEITDLLENGVPGSPSWRTKGSCSLGVGMIGFDDQEPNRLLARRGSLDGSLATLDLSEASDRVLNRHVVDLLSGFPRLSAAVQATRTTKADVPGHGVIPLLKFASMGSALCFPMEAMIFLTIIVTAVSYQRGEPPSRRLINSLRDTVRVYGDDIIVPVEYVDSVCRMLSDFGLVVNLDKSFWNGKFRESCGGDYYDGEWVTPIRLKKDLPRTRADVDEVVALVAYRNRLYWGGFWRTASVIDDRLRVLFKGSFPVVEETAAVLGRESIFAYEAEWAHPDLHTPLVRGWVRRSVTPESPISGEGALLKFLIKPGILPSQDPDHLERQGRPVGGSIKPTLSSPY